MEYTYIKNLKGSGDDCTDLYQGSNGKKYIKKIIPFQDIQYNELKNAEIDGIPAITEVIETEYETRADIVDVTVLYQEYIEGLTLEEYIKEKGAQSEEETYRIFLELCDILIALHSKKIIHRDIKPLNIIIDNNHKLWLIDFGSAKKIKEAYDNSDTKIIDTRPGGTFWYAAPEQMGTGSGISDERTDIYGLGRTIKRFIGYKEYNGYLKKVIHKCDRLDSKDRFKSVKELKQAVIDAKREYDIFDCNKISVPKIDPKLYKLGKQTFSIGFIKKNKLTIWSDGLKWNNENIDIDNIKDIYCPGISQTGRFSFRNALSIKISFFDNKDDIEFSTSNKELKKYLWYAIGPRMMKATLDRHIQEEKARLFKAYKKPEIEATRDILSSNEISILFNRLYFNKIVWEYSYEELYNNYGFVDFDLCQYKAAKIDKRLRDELILKNFTDFNSFKSIIGLITLKAIVEYKARNLAALTDCVDELMYMFHRQYF